MGAGPDRLEHPVGETSPEDVLDGAHRQEVIHAEHVALVHPLGEKPIERSCALEVLPKRLLENHLAVCGKSRPVERRDRAREHGRGQREVDGDGALAGDARGNADRIGEIEPPIARRLEQSRRVVGRSALQPVGGPGSELIVVPVLAAGAHELESVGQLTAGLERSEAGKQVPAHQVARAAEHDEPPDHLAARAALASVTPAATTPM